MEGKDAEGAEEGDGIGKGDGQWRITIFRALGRDKLLYNKNKKYFQPKLYIEPNQPVYAALQRHEHRA